MLREGPFEPEVEVRDDECPFVSKEKGEVPGRLEPFGDLDAVHRAG